MPTLSASDEGFPRSSDSVETISFRGQNISVLVHGDATDDAFTVIDYEAPEGTQPPPHRHDFAEVFYVLEGQLTAEIGDDTVEASAGEAVYVPRGVTHAPRSDGYVRLLGLAVPAGIERYFEEVAEIIEAHDGPVTMEALGDKVIPVMKKYTIEPIMPPERS